MLNESRGIDAVIICYTVNNSCSLWDRKTNSGFVSVATTHWHPDSLSALLEPCHQGESQGLHCTRENSRERVIASASIEKTVKEYSINITCKSLVDVHKESFLLTMREGTPTYSLIQDCYEEHVAVFEIRFHFIDRLDPKIEQQTQYSATTQLLIEMRQQMTNTYSAAETIIE